MSGNGFDWSLEREAALFEALKDNPPFASERATNLHALAAKLSAQFGVKVSVKDVASKVEEFYGTPALDDLAFVRNAPFATKPSHFSLPHEYELDFARDDALDLGDITVVPPPLPPIMSMLPGTGQGIPNPTSFDVAKHEDFFFAEGLMPLPAQQAQLQNHHQPLQYHQHNHSHHGVEIAAHYESFDGILSHHVPPLQQQQPAPVAPMVGGLSLRKAPPGQQRKVSAAGTDEAVAPFPPPPTLVGMPGSAFSPGVGRKRSISDSSNNNNNNNNSSNNNNNNYASVDGFNSSGGSSNNSSSNNGRGQRRVPKKKKHFGEGEDEVVESGVDGLAAADGIEYDYYDDDDEDDHRPGRSSSSTSSKNKKRIRNLAAAPSPVSSSKKYKKKKFVEPVPREDGTIHADDIIDLPRLNEMFNRYLACYNETMKDPHAHFGGLTEFVFAVLLELGAEAKPVSLTEIYAHAKVIWNKLPEELIKRFQTKDFKGNIRSTLYACQIFIRPGESQEEKKTWMLRGRPDTEPPQPARRGR